VIATRDRPWIPNAKASGSGIGTGIVGGTIKFNDKAKIWVISPCSSLTTENYTDRDEDECARNALLLAAPACALSFLLLGRLPIADIANAQSIDYKLGAARRVSPRHHVRRAVRLRAHGAARPLGEAGRHLRQPALLIAPDGHLAPVLTAKGFCVDLAADRIGNDLWRAAVARKVLHCLERLCEVDVGGEARARAVLAPFVLGQAAHLGPVLRRVPSGEGRRHVDIVARQLRGQEGRLVVARERRGRAIFAAVGTRRCVRWPQAVQAKVARGEGPGDGRAPVRLLAAKERRP